MERAKLCGTNKEANVWHVEMFDRGKGYDEILNSDAQGQLLIRDKNGDVLGRWLPNFYVSQFTLVLWEDDAKPSHVMVPVSDEQGRASLVILDKDGNTIRELDSPLGNLFNNSATPVQFGSADYFAVLESGLNHSMLVIYDKNGSIAYREILGEKCQAIAKLPGQAGDDLLIGCSAEVWDYSRVQQ